jgi:poly(A) polymerase
MSSRGTGQRTSPIRPLLEGDAVKNRRVEGFAWKAPAAGQRSNHSDDRLLFEGDERFSEPPDRPVPQSADGALAENLIRTGQVGARESGRDCVR